MKGKPNFFDRAGRFISGNGFYLVLLVCVAAIGISGYFLVRSVMEEGEVEEVSAVGEAEHDVPVMAEDPPEVEAIRPVLPSHDPAETVSLQPEEKESAPAETVSPQPEPSKPAETAAARVPLVFTWPVNGPVIASFSVEALVYDETMLDWRVHEGVDLAAEEGTRVLAVAAGTVTDVYEDELMGMTVVIDHGDGLVSLYSNLSEEPSAEEGQRVYTGDIIGSVGCTAAAEMGRAPHLHLAMYLDGQAVDPEGYLPEN